MFCCIKGPIINCIFGKQLRRRYMSRKKRYAYVLFLLSFFLGLLLLSHKTQSYNKYTAGGPAARAGILDLREAVFSEHSKYFLSGGTLYRQVSSPNDPAAHSVGIYQLTILLPPGSRQYALEVPRVRGNFQLWINGQCYINTISSYMLNTSHALLTFEASDRVELVLATDDVPRRQSGFVYLPAFGSPSALWLLMVFRIVIGSAICVLALSLAVACVIVSFNPPKRQEGLACMILCLCYVGSIVRVPFHMLSPHSAFFDLLSTVSSLCMIPALFLVFGAVSRMPRTWFCIVYVQYPFVLLFALSPLFAAEINIYIGWLKSVYFGVAFLALAGSYLWYIRHSHTHSELLLTGAGVISAALLNTCIFKQYEPIFFQWPIEDVVFFVLSLFGISYTRYFNRLYAEKRSFQERAQADRCLAAAESQKYKTLALHMDKFKQCKHEMRSQLLTLLHLLHEGEQEALELQLQEYIGHTEYRAYCNHSLLNAILTCSFTDDILSHISFRSEIAGLPDQLPLADTDLCSLIANILDNAIEGCDRLPEGHDKQVVCTIQVQFGHLCISCINTCPDDIVEHNGQIISSKPEQQLHGYGLLYMRACVKKYEGLFQVSHGNGRFAVNIAIPLEN